MRSLQETLVGPGVLLPSGLAGSKHLCYSLAISVKLAPEGGRGSDGSVKKSKKRSSVGATAMIGVREGKDKLITVARCSELALRLGTISKR